MTRLAVFVLALTVSAFQAQPLVAQDTSQLTEIERLRQLQAMEDVIASADQLLVLVEQAATTSRLQCMMAIGYRPFCDCLSEKTPVSANFVTYVRITTTSKADLGYADLDADGKSLVDKTLSAREACVMSIFRTQGTP